MVGVFFGRQAGARPVVVHFHCGRQALDYSKVVSKLFPEGNNLASEISEVVTYFGLTPASTNSLKALKVVPPSGIQTVCSFPFGSITTMSDPNASFGLI